MWIPPVHSALGLGDILASLPGASNEERALERLLMQALGAPSALLTASGTHALQAALMVAADALPPNRRLVALPAFTCYDVATAVLATDLQVVFYDVDPTHLVPDADSLGRALDEGAGVVVAANLYGLPLDWDLLGALARDTGAVIVEDAAQAAGSTWQGRPAGSLAELSVLSFGRGKGWTGSGGGALLARGRFAELDLQLHLPEQRPRHTGRRMLLAGTALAQWTLARPWLYGLPARVPALHLGETRFRPPSPTAGIHAYQAALALRTRRRLEWETVVRQRNVARVLDEVSSLAGVDVTRPLAGGTSGWLRLPARVGGLRERLPDDLNRLGVYRSYPRALPEFGPLVPRFHRTPPDMPGARALVAELVTLPTHSRTPVSRLLDGLPAALRDARTI
jgi:dTDP-4-amino-4,6-dideoxygalactose transaminase